MIKRYEAEFNAAQIPFKWISEKDSGIYNAWNKGLKMASGEWIAFLGSDDQYLPNALSIFDKAIAENPNSDFVCAKAKFLDGSTFQRPFGTSFNWDQFKSEMKILHAGGFHNSKYFDKYGIFDENFKICGDYEILLRKGVLLKVHFIDQFLISMQIGGVSSANEVRALEEARLAKLKHNTQGRLRSKMGIYVILFKIRLGKIKRAILGMFTT